MSSTQIAAPKSDQSADVCQLLSLPRELRDMIYSELFNGRYSNVPETALIIQRGSLRSKDTPSQLNILRTSQQINTEATPILYHENSFHIMINTPHQMKMMRHMLNREQPPPPHDSPSSQISQIQRLKIEINLGGWYSELKKPLDTELPLAQVRRLGSSGIQSERCVVKLSQCWWDCCCNRIWTRGMPRETIKLLKKLSMFRTVTIQVNPGTKNVDRNPGVETVPYPYLKLEKDLKGALGSGQIESSEGSRRLVFKPSGSRAAKARQPADFAVRNMGGHNIWSSLSDPAQDSEFWA